MGLIQIKIFGENYHSSMYFCYLKCGTGVFGEPNNCFLCACNKIAVFLVVFAKEADSLINIVSPFKSRVS